MISGAALLQRKRTPRPSPTHSLWGTGMGLGIPAFVIQIVLRSIETHGLFAH